MVGGVAAACKEARCALLGGETAEMPGVYEPGEIDLAGTIIGVVERERIIDGSRIQPGDVILGLPSTGLHTNGFSLARRVLGDMEWETSFPELNGSIGDALLQIHRSYLKPIQQLWDAGVEVHGLAHITGGGFQDNLPRIFPAGVSAIIRRGSWPKPPIFDLIQRQGHIPDDEMFHVFNMGLGMLVIVPAEQATIAATELSGEIYRLVKSSWAMAASLLEAE